MKTKKLISLLCAAAMSASAFAGLAVTASAADVYSADFEDGTYAGWTLTNGTVSVEDDSTGKYLKLQGSGSGNRTGGYTLSSPVSGEYTIEFDTMMTRGNGMGRIMHTNQIAFTNSTTADSRNGEGIIEEVNAKKNTNYQSGGGAQAAVGALKIDLRPYLDNQWIINDDATAELVAYPEEAVSIADQTWVRVQAAVNADKTTVTVIDNAGNKLVDAVEYANSTNAINQIFACSNRGDGGSGIIALDNIRIYNGAAEELKTDGLRGDAEIIVPTPKPVIPKPATYEQAPKLVAPESATVAINQNFSTDVDVTMSDSGQDVTDLEGLNIHIGGRSGGDTGTSIKTADYAKGDKVLTLSGGQYSTAGRGPLVSATEALTAGEGGVSAVMTFAVNLTSEAAGGAGRLYILGTSRQSGSDGQGSYNAVMGVLATDEYTYSEGESETSLVYQVEPYTWYKVAVITSGDKYRIWVAKAGESFDTSAQIQRDHVGQGESNIGIANLGLPFLAVTSAAGNGSQTNSIARIDNMLTYTGVAGSEGPRNLLPKEEEPDAPAIPIYNVTVTNNDDGTVTLSTEETETFDAVLIGVKYDADGKLASVKTEPVKSLSASTPATKTIEGDKFFVWDSVNGMVAYTK